MSLAELSIRRPIFITCIILVMLAVGSLCIQRMGVDLFPDVQFPFVTITVTYPGAGPSEIETLISKPLEEEISSLSGIKRLKSVSAEGYSLVITEFNLETDIKVAEQQIRDRVGSAKSKLPKDIQEPTIRRIDPADQPIVVLALNASLPETELYDLANERLRPQFEQIRQVGQVDLIGGRKREIQVILDRKKLKTHELSALHVFQQLRGQGENIPNGKVDLEEKGLIFRTLGEFEKLQDIPNTLVNFFGNDVPIQVKDIATLRDTLEDEKTRAFVNGEKALFIEIYRQTGANTVAVVDALKKRVDQINQQLAHQPGNPKLTMVRDMSLWIRANIADVKESIFLGILLAVAVVFLFLGSGRSTLITGLALPNSLIGAFILMSLAGFTINIMTLLALSLSVGLLIDDAIVVRENIFRHLEQGSSPLKAAQEGTAEVRLAVIATTLAVISVFGPVGFLKGVVGQFFREFGLTICFVMAISLFDALTIAPMLSAYFASNLHDSNQGFFQTLWTRTIGKILKAFDHFQVFLENLYEKTLHLTLKHPLWIMSVSGLMFLGSCVCLIGVTKTFLPPQDAGEFIVSLEMPPGTHLNAMQEVAQKVDRLLRSHPEIEMTALKVGTPLGKSEVAEFYIQLVHASQRKEKTITFKEKIREQLKAFSDVRPQVKDFDAVAGGQRPFNVSFTGLDQKQLEEIASKAFQIIQKHPGLKDVDINTRSGKPEFQIHLNPSKAEQLGVSSALLGMELRTQVEGQVAAKFRQEGKEYDIRVRVQDPQRNLKDTWQDIYVPNLNQRLIRLKDVADGHITTGPATINRQDRGRFIMISGDLSPGAGLGNIMQDVKQIFEKQIVLPPEIQFNFIGQAENFTELLESILMAAGFGTLFIFLVLASLYESFITPFTIMLALPLAIGGSFVALWITHESLNIFSMIGCIMLLGVATKNSILLVDATHQLLEQGLSRPEAILKAGKTRLRPILMTTLALIAGTIPVALGLNEASKQRTSMGIAIIGGLISSTLLTLIVVPAAFSYVDRFRIFSKTTLKRWVNS